MEAARKSGAPLVGLSALMTTTVESMEKTIRLLRESVDVKIVVGGAVLTEDYAMRIGADFYARDAMALCGRRKACLAGIEPSSPRPRLRSTNSRKGGTPVKRIAFLIALTMLFTLTASAEGWSFGESWEEAPSAYVGAWDADGAPAVSEENESGGAAPADHGGWETSAESGQRHVCGQLQRVCEPARRARHGLAGACAYPTGEQVLAYGGEGDFYRVEYAGMRGYVHADYLSSERASFSMRLAADPGYARLDTSAIEAYASSEQVDQYGYYAAANANDADPSTAWAEGANGAGEGEWLSLFFSEQKVAGFAIRAGYQRSADAYNASGRLGEHPRERGRGERLHRDAG